MNSHGDTLQYFVLKLDGRVYGGWYRLIDSDCLEVLAPGFFTIVLLDGESPEALSCRLLEQHIRVRLRQGAPVPPASVLPAPNTPDHVCEDAVANH